MTEDAGSLTTAVVRRKPGSGVLWLSLTAGLAVVLAALLMLFIMPSLKSGPQSLQVGIVGSADAVTQVSALLDEQHPGAFVLVPSMSAAEVEAEIRTRELSGGLILDGPTAQILVASAGSTAISGSITAAGTALAEGMHLGIEVTDVVALPDGDPTGVGIGGLAFPLVFGGIVPAVAYRSVLAGRRGWIFGGLIGFSAVGGIVVAGMLRFAFGAIEHSFWPVAGAVALGIAALAIPLAALNEVFGGKGFTIGAMVMMFLGNPFAGIATGASWLPAGVSVLGQILPPGAAGTLVRAVAYFDGAGGGVAATTLIAWVVVGVALWCVAPRLRKPTESETAA